MGTSSLLKNRHAVASDSPMGFTASERSAPQSKHIRFTLWQDKLLDSVCQHLGVTLQNFIQLAAVEKAERIDKELQASKEYRDGKKRDGERKREVRGLGLRREETREVATVAEAPAPQAPVIVNVAASSPANEMTMLVDFVTKGSPLMRSSRLEQARAVIAASTDGAAKDAALAALDAAVQARGEPKRAGVLDWLKR